MGNYSYGMLALRKKECRKTQDFIIKEQPPLLGLRVEHSCKEQIWKNTSRLQILEM